MVSTTRSTTCLSDHSRSGPPSVPRKYFWARMFVAFALHVEGTSTPSCSNATTPVAALAILASRRSHVTVSYGWIPGVVKERWMPMPVRSGAMAMSEKPPAVGCQPMPRPQPVVVRSLRDTRCGVELQHRNHTRVNPLTQLNPLVRDRSRKFAADALAGGLPNGRKPGLWSDRGSTL